MAPVQQHQNTSWKARYGGVEYVIYTYIYLKVQQRDT